MGEEVQPLAAQVGLQHAIGTRSQGRDQVGLARLRQAKKTHRHGALRGRAQARCAVAYPAQAQDQIVGLVVQPRGATAYFADPVDRVTGAGVDCSPIPGQVLG
ncbi:hypothetical protein D3C75_1019220 [compost metagenome]